MNVLSQPPFTKGGPGGILGFPVKTTKTALTGLCVIHPQVFEDSRGFFFESFHLEKFKALGLRTDWVQDNHSGSVKDTIRGLHFQRGAGQAKLVRCIRGEIWDVAVDIRPDSSTFGRWEAIVLSDTNRDMLYVPEGFAHGYAVLSDWADVMYKCGTMYDSSIEDGIRWNDPTIGVNWPIAQPLLSDRDQTTQTFSQYCLKMGITR